MRNEKQKKYHREYMREYYKKKREEGKCSAQCGRLAPENESMCKTCKTRRKKNSDEQSEERTIKQKNTAKLWAANNRDRLNAKQRRYYQKIKKTVFDHYGRICKCCGYDDPRFVTIDHINNDGNEHRRELSGWRENQSGKAFYTDVIQRDFPDDLQTLCWNCNMAKARVGKGTCPHQLDIAPKYGEYYI